MAVLKRKPTSKEKKLWKRFENSVQQMAMELMLTELLGARLRIAYDFAKLYKVKIPDKMIVELKEDSKNFIVLKDRAKVINRQYEWMYNGELGFNVRGGDLDIIAPSGTNADKLAFYKTGGFEGIPLIMVGVVLVAAAIFYVALIRDENEKINRRFNQVLGAANKEFCKNPDSATCQAWKDRKASPDWQENISTVEQIKQKLSELGTFAAKGTGAGIMLAIPILMIYILTRKGNK